MDIILTLAVVAVIIVLIFDYTNGFHDASNIIATVIASRAMTPVQAVIIVAVFEFLGPMLGGTAVANTIGKFVQIGDLEALPSIAILLCGIFGAIFWNLATWWFGIPSSSSHALVGGLAGAVIVSAGADHVVWGFQELGQGHFTGVTKVLLALIISPIIG
ncbi:MAG TPA: inorganic phosphate transporter, partial [Gammaproteobacteria bacterium]|nr:inorganic phosphate transporter [Gammaproteobacteria bacterium]